MKRDKPNYDAKYAVRGYSAFAVEKAGGDVRWITGYDADREAENLKEAKRIARYLLSEDYRRSGEMTERLAYAEVSDRNGEVILDLWREGYTYVDPTEEINRRYCERLEADAKAAETLPDWMTEGEG